MPMRLSFVSQRRPERMADYVDIKVGEEVVRQQFEGGGMRDSQTGKPRFDLLLPEHVPYKDQMLTRWAKHMAAGAERYEDHAAAIFFNVMAAEYVQGRIEGKW